MSISASAAKVLALSRIKGLGLKTFHTLLERFGSVERIWQADTTSLNDLKLNGQTRAALEACISDANPELSEPVERWLETPGRYVLGLEDAPYPALLREVCLPPPLLYIEGHPDALARPALAVVGARLASLSGRAQAFRLSAELAGSGLNIISGLARGIDAEAHRGALSVSGSTVAVLATGLDQIYPKQHGLLAQEVREVGALVSEMPLGTKPIAGNFPRRNRIISGLSHGVLLIEAGLKSGSLITANCALEQNREVLVVPGSIDNPLSRGGHQLIKDGAALVDDAADVLALLGLNPVSDKSAEPLLDQMEGLSAAQLALLKLLGYEVQSFDSLCCGLEVSAQDLSELLLSLELMGLVAPVAGGYQRVNAVKFPA